MNLPNKIPIGLEGFSPSSWRVLVERFNATLDYLTERDQVKTEHDPIEHCSEPDCPECDMAAYRRGLEDGKKKMDEEMDKFIKGFGYRKKK